MNNNIPPILPEGYWKDSQFCVARHYGIIRINGDDYIIVDRYGTDVFELSVRAKKEGKEKAIEPGEPCDLCRRDWIPCYKALGREKIIELVKQGRSLAEVKQYIKNLGNNEQAENLNY